MYWDHGSEERKITVQALHPLAAPILRGCHEHGRSHATCQLRRAAVACRFPPFVSAMFRYWRRETKICTGERIRLGSYFLQCGLRFTNGRREAFKGSLEPICSHAVRSHIPTVKGQSPSVPVPRIIHHATAIDRGKVQHGPPIGLEGALRGWLSRVVPPDLRFQLQIRD